MVDIGKGLCKLGIHALDWEFSFHLRGVLNRSCLQEGWCRRCENKRGNRTSHDWGKIDKTDCLRCGAVKPDFG